jgi:hypothetical protein
MILMGNSKPTPPDIRVTYPAIRLVRADTDELSSGLPGLPERDVTYLSATAALG